MNVDIALVSLDSIRNLRDLYRQEMNCQIVHDSLHARFLTDIYLIRVNEQVAGYGCVMSGESETKDLIKEYYILPVHRGRSTTISPVRRRRPSEDDRGTDERHSADPHALRLCRQIQERDDPLS